MKKVFLTALVLILSQISKAEVEKSEDLVIIKENPNALYENSSEHLRINKKYQATVMIFGVGPLPGSSTALNLGLYLDRNSLLTLSASRLKRGTICSGSLTCNDSGQSLGVYYKKFISNSFYFSVGVDQRQTSYAEEVSNSGPFDYSFNFDGTTTMAGFVIGNQWQWADFTLGCDWFGYSAPLAYKIKNETGTGSIPEYWQNNLDEKKNTYVRNSTIQALRFYLGASF